MKSLAAALLMTLGAAALLASWRGARAEEAIEVYQVQCMAELDVLEIRLLDLADETKRQLVARHDKTYAKSRGLFVPALYTHLDFDPADPRYGIEAETFPCDMVSGHAVLTAHPEPVAGQPISAAVTITRDKYLVVDDVPFRHCASGAPLTGLTYAESADARIKLAGRFNGEEPVSLEVVPGVRWEREPVLRPDNVGYAGIHYQIHEWREYEDCRYQGPGTPTARLRKTAIGFKASGPPPPLADDEIRVTTRPVSRSYAKRWDVRKLYQVSCLPELDFFEVRRLDFYGVDTARRTKDRKKIHPERRYHLYAPEWNPSSFIVNARDLHPDPDKPETNLDRPPTEFECKLSSASVRLMIWSTWLGELYDGPDIIVSLRAADRLLANLVHFERCAFIGRLSFRSADRSFTLDGYPPTDRFVVADGEPMGLIDDSPGTATRGKRIAVFGEDPERFTLNQFYSCRYVGADSPSWERAWWQVK